MAVLASEVLVPTRRADVEVEPARSKKYTNDTARRFASSGRSDHTRSTLPGEARSVRSRGDRERASRQNTPERLTDCVRPTSQNPD